VVMLDEPAYDARKWTMVDPSQPDWYEKSKITCAWPPIKSYIAYSARLETAAPEVVRLFENIRLEDSDASVWSNAVYVAKKDPADVARSWVEQHKSATREWLFQK
jgi:glycine betaine/proline transport system substrate-binding protein